MGNRIKSLDFLRGMMAISIMIYHLTSWLFNRQDSSTLLGRLGVYGVSIFFILSGLTMAIVYSNYIKDAKTCVNFYIRRLFRILPLLWICSFATIIIRGKNPGLDVLILNLTASFGFVSPGTYIVTGAWSIGNEMVYYAMTPIIIHIFNKSKIYGNIITLITLALTIYFSFFILNS